MTFSIIIPVYNVAPYLRVCLDSVQVQTFTDWEAICVDDGSTDGAGAILNEYAQRDSRFKVVHQANMGVSRARQVGLEKSTGKWIAFIDPDDLVEEEYLRHFADKVVGAKIDMAWTDFKEDVGGVVAPVKQDIKEDPIEMARATVDGRLLGVLWNKIFSREFLERHNIRFVDGRVSAFEDFCFVCEFLAHGPAIGYVPVADYHYVRRPGSAIYFPKEPKVEMFISDTFVPTQHYVEKVLCGAGLDDALRRRRIKAKAQWCFDSAVCSGFFWNVYPDLRSIGDVDAGFFKRIFYALSVWGLRDFVLLILKCKRRFVSK